MALGAIFVLLRKNRGSGDSTGLVLLQNRINEIDQTLKSGLSESNQAMQNQFGLMQNQASHSSKMIADVTEKLVKLDETNKQVLNFSDQLKNLQDMLKNPKQRGILGEYYLETVLKNVLPPGNFEMQYAFADGMIVDAIVWVKDKIIPIDSKFSLENYNRLAEEKNEAERDRLEKLFVGDLKNRILETAQYIRPQEGTLDFAFMFIPHEAIYYDLLINKIGGIAEETENLIQRAANKYHVIIVSPTSFMAYLQTVLQGLRALQIEESAKEIRKRVEELGRHLLNYEVYVKKMGTGLGTTVNAYNNAYKELGKVDKDVLRITGEKAGLSPEILEKPLGGED